MVPQPRLELGTYALRMRRSPNKIYGDQILTTSVCSFVCNKPQPPSAEQTNANPLIPSSLTSRRSSVESRNGPARLP